MACALVARATAPPAAVTRALLALLAQTLPTAVAALVLATAALAPPPLALALASAALVLASAALAPPPVALALASAARALAPAPRSPALVLGRVGLGHGGHATSGSGGFRAGFCTAPA